MILQKLFHLPLPQELSFSSVIDCKVTDRPFLLLSPQVVMFLKWACKQPVVIPTI